jgi:hypothetical protein
MTYHVELDPERPRVSKMTGKGAFLDSTKHDFVVGEEESPMDTAVKGKVIVDSSL